MIKVSDRLAISKENILNVKYLLTDHKGNFSVKVTYNNRDVFIPCGKSEKKAQEIFEKIIAEVD